MSREFQEIFKRIESLSDDAEPMILATVVDVRGSSYRLPGAKMLIDKNFNTIGTVSGGCLEADVLERARRVLETGAAEVFTYDTTDAAREDSIFSLNMGCRGVIQILLERARIDLINFYRRLRDARRDGVAATLIENGATENSSYRKIGERLLLDGETIVESDFDREIQENLLPACLEVLREKKSKTLVVGENVFFLEFVAPPLSVVIFGAGADAIPLVETAKISGWRVSIVDHRAGYASAERFPEADEIIIARSENLNGELAIDANTAAVVMTHNYEHDANILRFLLQSNAFYVGSLGPRRRAESILRELRAAGEDFADRQIKKLYAPVGLDIGAETPETIALSIVAEIQSVASNRAGGFLRERKESIYNRNAIA